MKFISYCLLICFFLFLLSCLFFGYYGGYAFLLGLFCAFPFCVLFSNNLYQLYRLHQRVKLRQIEEKKRKSLTIS